MKIRHLLGLVLIIIAVLFLWHNYRSHGGVMGVKQGIGFGGM